MDEARRLERGRELEGYAFTLCKAALLALVFRRATLLVTALGSAVLYLAAARDGVREWRCFVKPSWVVVVWLAVAAREAAVLLRR